MAHRIGTIEYNQALLALCMWREARGEGLHGMRAVGHVVRNRVNAWRQPWHQVITAKNQFSAMSVPGDGQLVVWGDPHALEFQDVMELAGAIYNGEDTDPTGGALYYWNPRTANSPWFEREVRDKRPRTRVIGNHEFYA